MGRSTVRTQAIEDEIVSRISAGEPLASICREDHMPGLTTVWEWTKKDATLAERIARAREAGHDVIAAGALAIADEPPPMTERGVDSGHVAWQKNRIWTRLQLLAKWDPKRYGDKLELAGDAKAPLTIQLVRLAPEPPAPGDPER